MRKGMLLMGAMALVVATAVEAQPRYDRAALKSERLDRGVVAVRDGGRVIVSWRVLGNDAAGESFDVYRDGVKLNRRPLRRGGSMFVDEKPDPKGGIYEVRSRKRSGSYRLRGDAPDGYLPIPLQKPEGGTSPDGYRYAYVASDASIGDVDGDGQYEIFLKWDPTNAKDNMFAGFTGPTLIDCYRLDGTRLWRIDLGRNVRSGAHYVQFMVFDFDGDGRAELMVKTADGTTDGQGRVIGDAQADWRYGIAAIKADPEAYLKRIREEREEAARRREQWLEIEKGLPPTMTKTEIHNRRRSFLNVNTDNKTGRIMDGPEYITVFNGLTGAAMATADYIPERGRMEDWGDDHANRSERYLAAVGYLDGRHASGIFCRGYYTRSVIAVWDWDGKQLRNRWTFDTKDPQWASYAGQGNHNLRVADVDGDGCDEITYGSMAIDNDGRGLYNTGFGHGDAMHLTAFDPQTTRLQVWDCHENRRDGSDFRDARTGEVIFQIKSKEDVGRCMAADIDPTNPGLEMWSSESGGIRNIKGKLVTPKHADEKQEDDGDNNALRIRGARIPTNFGIWWDGDLLREMLDHETVSKYDWETGRMKTVCRFDGVQFNNGSKSNPCLCADILGDWREEVLARNHESTELRLYVSTIPTEYRINCLEEDVPYRLSVAHQNTAYNQPTHTGFYLGPDKTVNPFLK